MVLHKEHLAPLKMGGNSETASEEGKVHRGRRPEEEECPLGEGSLVRAGADKTPEDHRLAGHRAAAARNCSSLEDIHRIGRNLEVLEDRMTCYMKTTTYEIL